MERKKVLAVFLIIGLLVVMPVVFADEIDDAYACLEEKLGADCADKDSSTEQIAFSLLAGAYDSNIKSDCLDLLEDRKDDYCWGNSERGSCNLKSTALAVLALERINKDTEEAVDWIVGKQRVSKDLDWFLEIDSYNDTVCDITEGEAVKNEFTIDEDKTVSGSSNCLSVSGNGYFLKISDGCLEKQFTISCDEDFKSTVIYQKPDSDTYHVSSETHSASGGSEQGTIESIDSYCFGTTACDYQGTLWSVLALSEAGEDASIYLPYLSEMADEPENRKYLPSSFLYLMSGDGEFYTELMEEQKTDYWDNWGKKYYSTALGLLALERRGTGEEDLVKDWLLKNQDEDGCWNSGNIRDTAFILYAGWAKEVSSGGGDEKLDCESEGFYCLFPTECDLGDKLSSSQYECENDFKVCCKEDVDEETCSEMGGEECDNDEECKGKIEIASDSDYCCIGKCEEKEEPKENECEEAEYTCRYSDCNDDEEETSAYDCVDYGDVCCKDKTDVPPSPEPEGSWLWIIILIVLIILVVLGIVFRNRLRMMFFKRKGGGKPSGGDSPIPPPLFGSGLRPRQIIPRGRAPPPRRPMPRPAPRGNVGGRSGQKDKDFEETMRKLKEMSG